MEPEARPLLYLDKPGALKRCIEKVLRAGCVAVDTESNSMYAYRERLCLLQLSTDDEDFIVDPLAMGDLAPLRRVFEAEDVEKVFHDGEFDVCQIRRAMETGIRNLYDTKVAAVALGLPSCGLAALLEEHFGVKLDKRFQRSNWGARPLSREQLEYARMDTAYLLPLADILEEKVEEMGGIVPMEVRSECRRLESLVPEEWCFDPEGWTRLPGARRLEGPGRGALRALYASRNKEAARRDLPPFKILPNAALLELAQSRPRRPQDLATVASLSESLARRHGRWILKAVAEAKGQQASTPAASAPSGANGTPAFSEEEEVLFDLLRKWRKERADRRPTDASHIVPRTALLRLVRERPADLASLAASGILEPWRVEAYGEEILEVLRNGAGASGKGPRRRGR